jgi:TRAP transporter 4TM/12TM fusion protein
MDDDLRFRKLTGATHFIWLTLLVVVPILGILAILNVPASLNLTFYEEQYTGLFMGLVYALCFLGVRAGPNVANEGVPLYDWLLALIGLGCGLYIFIFFPRIAATLGWVTTDRVIVGGLFILVTLEALRRVTGPLLVVVVVAFLAYAFVAPHMPGPLKGSPTQISDLINYLYLDGNNGLGLIRIAATIGLAFILFGQVLSTFGGGQMINDIVVSVCGTMRGGPAKAAVIGSSLVGTVTGGAATNVMLTGVVTIPLMIKSGFRAVYAGAVESVASTGGQIMPPVMGIAAFLIADNLGRPYSQVALAAAVPAILYYIGLFVQIDLAAAREGRLGLPRSELPPIGRAVVSGWLIFPIFGFLIFIIMGLGYEPATSGVYATALAFLLLLFHRAARAGMLRKIIFCLADTSRNIIAITIVLAAAGLIVGVTNITGLGFNMALALSNIGSQSLLLLLVTSAVVCIILGMGMPTVAAYTLVAILVAPAMVKAGASPMSAHLFILFFAVVSNFTPPVALACYAASAIARADATQIGWVAMRLGLAAYVVPFLFVLSPSLILEGDPWMVVASVITALLGMPLLAAALESYLFHPLSSVARAFCGLLGILLLVPVDTSNYLTELANLIGLVGATVFAIWSWRSATTANAVASTTSN